jgi:hypothetical protein
VGLADDSGSARTGEELWPLRKIRLREFSSILSRRRLKPADLAVLDGTWTATKL